MACLGNAFVNSILENNLQKKISVSCSNIERQDFITRKYAQKKFCFKENSSVEDLSGNEKVIIKKFVKYMLSSDPENLGKFDNLLHQSIENEHLLLIELLLLNGACPKSFEGQPSPNVVQVLNAFEGKSGNEKKELISVETVTFPLTGYMTTKNGKSSKKRWCELNVHCFICCKGESDHICLSKINVESILQVLPTKHENKIQIITENSTEEYFVSYQFEMDFWMRGFQAVLENNTWNSFFRSGMRNDFTFSGMLNRKSLKLQKCEPFWAILRHNFLYLFDNQFDRNFVEKIDTRNAEISREVLFPCCAKGFELVDGLKVYRFCSEQCEDWILSIQGTRIFGTCLSKLELKGKCPIILLDLIQELKKRNMKNIEPGNVQELKSRINRGEQLNMKEVSTTQLYGMLVDLFKDSKETVICSALFDEASRCEGFPQLKQILLKLNGIILTCLSQIIDLIADSELSLILWSAVLFPDLPSANRLLGLALSNRTEVKELAAMDSNALAMSKMKLAFEQRELSLRVHADNETFDLNVSYYVTAAELINQLGKEGSIHVRADGMRRPILPFESIHRVTSLQSEIYFTQSPIQAYADHVTGWMWKEGGSVKTWRKRFFALSNRGFNYYKDAKMSQFIGTLLIEEKYLYIVDEYAKAPTRFCMCLKSDNEQRFLAVDSEQDRETWMKNFYALKNKVSRT